MIDGRHRFHLLQPHVKCPDLTGWYLELRPDDSETIMAVHKGVAALYFFKFGQDPHIQKDETQRLLYNPIRLAANWLVSVERFLMQGEAVLVNAFGGMMPLAGAIILDTVESSVLHWPGRNDDEKITVSRWPAGRHWYLSSNKGRVFCPAKYDSLAEARHEALRYVPAERIKTKECAGALPPE